MIAKALIYSTKKDPKTKKLIKNRLVAYAYNHDQASIIADRLKKATGKVYIIELGGFEHVKKA